MEGFERIADHTMTEPEVRAAFRAQIDREEIIGSLRGSMPELAEAQLPALAEAHGRNEGLVRGRAVHRAPGARRRKGDLISLEWLRGKALPCAWGRAGGQARRGRHPLATDRAPGKGARFSFLRSLARLSALLRC